MRPSQALELPDPVALVRDARGGIAAPGTTKRDIRGVFKSIEGGARQGGDRGYALLAITPTNHMLTRSILS